MLNYLKRLLGKIEKEEAKRTRLQLNASDFSAIYAIGDIHGCMSLLRAAYGRILADNKEQLGPKLIVFLGDYVDRGPSSRAVLDFLCKPNTTNVHHVCICGNHDYEFLRFIRDPRNNMAWLNFGGIETLRSYGIDAEHALKAGGGQAGLFRMVEEAVPVRHIQFLERIPTMLTLGKLVFVHAGIRPGIALQDQSDEDLMWIREPFLSDGPGIPSVIVHGHTVTREPQFTSGRVGIDTGAYSTGRLTVLKLAKGKALILQ